MKNLTLWTLIILNAALLLCFTDHLLRPSAARAQAGGMRRPGDYVMISGLVNGSTAGLVYVVDTVNGQLTALTYGANGGNGQIENMPPIDLNAVFATQPQPR
jgi:hypothetical protein